VEGTVREVKRGYELLPAVTALLTGVSQGGSW